LKFFKIFILLKMPARC